ncbi:hypothetical protein PoB_002359100 [Plakobranchus ocellatus]|uniref:Uncharacterized protein n=1 Tax=Plakobranchus ocellatus TaxID=259542 RepID=A0AAV3ZCV6_9GAST|nr:hypothetical protein PoB_002359100 [Plakobranchus ocellatus]
MQFWLNTFLLLSIKSKVQIRILKGNADGTVESEPILRSAGFHLSRARAPPPAPWLDGGPESLISPCCELKKSAIQPTKRILRSELTNVWRLLHRLRTRLDLINSNGPKKMQLNRHYKTGGAVVHLVGQLTTKFEVQIPVQAKPIFHYSSVLCPPSTKWVARSLKTRRKNRRRGKQSETIS